MKNMEGIKNMRYYINNVRKYMKNMRHSTNNVEMVRTM